MRPPPPFKPHAMHRQLVCKLDNMTVEKEVPVTAIDTYYDVKTGQLLLLQGDEDGKIVVYDITPIIRSELLPDMNPLDITINNTKRNPHREFQMEREERKKGKRGGGNDSDSDRGDE